MPDIKNQDNTVIRTVVSRFMIDAVVKGPDLTPHDIATLIPAQQQITLDDQPPQIMTLPRKDLINRRFGGPIVAQHQ